MREDHRLALSWLCNSGHEYRASRVGLSRKITNAREDYDKVEASFVPVSPFLGNR